MNINQEQIFQAKQELQQQIEEYDKKLTAERIKQETLTKVEELAKSILDYNELQRQISDRTHLFALLSAPPESLRSPFIKSELFSYFEAAETVGPEFVNFLVDDFLTQIRADIQSQEDDSVDLIQSEYKEYIIPGKIIAEHFNEIDELLAEMNRFCKMLDPNYDEATAAKVLEYAFRISIDADTRMDPTIQALKEMNFQYLTPEDRVSLLDHVAEHLGVLRYEQAKNQNLAMQKAIELLAAKEEKH